MSTTIRPARRIAVTLAMTGVAAFSAVAAAPSAFADTVPPVSDPAVVAAPAQVTPTVPPTVVYDKNGNPVVAPKICTPKDISDAATRVADATAKVAPLFALAAKSHNAATLLREQESKMTAYQVRMAELVATGLDSVGDKVAAQAQAAIDKAGEMDCLALPPGARF
jgi:hypothetical protein